MKILFLCMANSARSQMAEGWARELLGATAEIQSVGVRPCGYLHPWAVEAMSEAGVDIRGQHSKSLAEISADFLADVDYAITLCEDESLLSQLSSQKVLRWPLPDPAADPEESKSDVFRTVRDKIERRVRAFAEEVRLN